MKLLIAGFLANINDMIYYLNLIIFLAVLAIGWL